MSDDEPVTILTKPVRRSIRKPKETKVVTPKVVEPVVVTEPVPVKKEKKVRAKKVKEVPILSDSSDESHEPVKSKEESKTPKKANGWIDHVRKYRTDHPDVAYKDCLKLAKECYKKA